LRNTDCNEFAEVRLQISTSEELGQVKPSQRSTWSVASRSLWRRWVDCSKIAARTGLFDPAAWSCSTPRSSSPIEQGRSSRQRTGDAGDPYGPRCAISSRVPGGFRRRDRHL